MRRTLRGLALGCGLGLLAWAGLVWGVSRAATLATGLNWTANVAAPPGETPASALARFGGSFTRFFDDPWSGSTDPQRIRLVRRWMRYQPHSAPPGASYQLGNEPNLLEQDNALRSQTQADSFAVWYHDTAAGIRAANPTARLIGPGMWNWDGGGSGCCVKGSDAYAWFVAAHQAHYGTLPDMQYVAVQVYPWHSAAWSDPIQGLPTGLAQLDGALAWSAGRWPVVVTEWGSLRKYFSCTAMSQSSASRYGYTRGMLDGMAQRGVPFALYYGSHEQSCDSNGWMSWLIERDGSLTPEGQAHRDFAGGGPPPPPAPTATRTPAPTASATSTALPTAAASAPATSPPPPSATLAVPTIALEPSPVPLGAPTRTAIPAVFPIGGACVPGRRCPPTPMVAAP